MMTTAHVKASPRGSGRLGRARYPRYVAPPSGFGWSPSFRFIESSPGVFRVGLNTESLKVTTSATRYVAISDGNNADNGSSWALAHKSLWDAVNDAFTAGVAVTIYVEGSADPNNPTVYDYDNAWRSALAVDANIIVVSDRTTLAPGYAVSSAYMAPGGADLGAWASTGGGTPNTYVATLAAAPNAVVDASVVSAFGAATRLTLQSSVATVDASPGSYWHSAGNLYVRTADSRAPDAKLRALKAGVINGHINTSTVDCYIQGMTFEGGNARCLFIQSAATVTLVDCAATHGQAEGLSLTSTSASADHTITMIRCKALDCDADGLQYTASGASAVVRAIEVDCEMAGNVGAGTDQGSSAHFTAGNTSVSVVRVNPRCYQNKTQGVADVGGTTTWIMGGRISGEAIGFQLGGTGTAWVHGARLASNTTDLVTDNAGGTIRVTGTRYTTTSGPGTVEVYQP